MPTLAPPEMRQEDDISTVLAHVIPARQMINFVVPINGNRHESLIRFSKTWQKLRSKDQNVELTISMMDENVTSLQNTITLVKSNSGPLDGVAIKTSQTIFSRGPALENGLRWGISTQSSGEN